MTPFKTTLRVDQLEDRCTPTTFTAALGGGNSAVTLLIDVVPPTPIMPELVAVSRLLPNGDIQAVVPPTPVTPPGPNVPPTPIRELFPPGADRGLLQAAMVSSSMFIVPDNGGNF